MAFSLILMWIAVEKMAGAGTENMRVAPKTTRVDGGSASCAAFEETFRRHGVSIKDLQQLTDEIYIDKLLVEMGISCLKDRVEIINCLKDDD